MPAIITHTVLSHKVFDKFFADTHKESFFIGTIFPDIRVLGVVERDRTHFKNLRLKNVVSEDSFLTGFRFHSLVDEAREQFMRERNVYELCPESKYVELALKRLEDEMLYEKIENWGEFIAYLNTILPQQIEFGVDLATIKKWHGTIQEYFSQKPSAMFRVALSAKIGIQEYGIEEINRLVETMKENQEIERVIEEFYDTFEELVISHF